MHKQSILILTFSANASIVAPYVKAAVRDVKAYRDSKNYRKVPIGYSAGIYIPITLFEVMLNLKQRTSPSFGQCSRIIWPVETQLTYPISFL